MDWICRFGEIGCGIEDSIPIIGLVGTVFTLVAGFAFGFAYIRAAQFSKPVVEALENRLAEDENKLAELRRSSKVETDRLQAQNDMQAQQIKHLQELTTHAAKVEELRAEVRERTINSTTEHTAMLDALTRMSQNLATLNRTTAAIAKQMGVPVREGDTQ